MKDAPTGGISKKASRPRARKAALRTDWKRLRGTSDAELHARVAADPDIAPTDAAFWNEARLVLPRPKEIVTIRLDADLLEWFRRERGYQTRINAILRAYMRAQGNDAA
ncbi:MAG TPA: BrnA antitoxin family protein [Alphaproteobacteria bacterium]|nr:BrnA antitoxin family protein [Alphaproteobacteria bacterium]